MKIIVGSENKIKINTVKKVFEEIFKSFDLNIVGLALKSGVPETPYDKQTFDGARKRAIAIKNDKKEADFLSGLKVV